MQNRSSNEHNQARKRVDMEEGLMWPDPVFSARQYLNLFSHLVIKKELEAIEFELAGHTHGLFCFWWRRCRLLEEKRTVWQKFIDLHTQAVEGLRQNHYSAVSAFVRLVNPPPWLLWLFPSIHPLSSLGLWCWKRYAERRAWLRLADQLDTLAQEK